MDPLCLMVQQLLKDPLCHLVRGRHLYRANLGHLKDPLCRTDLLFLMDPLPRLRREDLVHLDLLMAPQFHLVRPFLTVPGPHLFREDLENLNLRRFRWDQQFHLVRGHHLYRANLDFLNRPLFPKAPLFLTVRRFHLGQPLH